MVQNDPQHAISIFLVSPAFIHLGNGSIFICESYPSHPHGDISVDKAFRGL